MAELLESSNAVGPTGGRPKSKRILELDALRAISCLNLLLFHFTYVYQNKYGFASPISYAFPYGKYGVELFFMLSGLVNAMTLLSKRKAGGFLMARCIRIFPSYWLVICLNVWLFLLIPMYHTVPTGDAMLANMTAMPNLFGYETMEPVTWTLQVEMLFYMFLMVALVRGWLDRPRRTMIIGIGLCWLLCSGFDWFAVTYPNSDWNGRFHVIDQLFFLRQFPLFAMGILLNELRSGRGHKKGLCLAILASGFVFHGIDQHEHNPAATVLLFGLLAASAFGKIPVLRFRPLIFISTISYSLYLFHNNLGCLVMKQFEWMGCSPWLTVALGTAFAIGLGSAVTFWFEQPITKFLNREWSAWKKRRAATTPATSQLTS